MSEGVPGGRVRTDVPNVLVIGPGAAGLRAAIAAHEAGSEVGKIARFLGLAGKAHPEGVVRGVTVNWGQDSSSMQMNVQRWCLVLDVGKGHIRVVRAVLNPDKLVAAPHRDSSKGWQTQEKYQGEGG